MGTIRTKGSASKEVTYDRMTVTITFSARENYSKDAVRKMTEECEEFLSTLKELGFDITKISADDNQISKHDYRDDNYTNAFRTLKWRSEYDLHFIDILTQLVEKGSYSVNLDIEPEYSNMGELHRTLLKEAALDAEKTANLLAESLGTRIKGPGKINVDPYSEYMTDEDTEYHCYGIVTEKERGIGLSQTDFSTLKNPTTIENENLVIEWDLEE